ncbi:non-ribosomal peptide synthetase [Alteromonas sp. a30]|uniref:non-ribosomal peptide synthetase n=1 Tax=Alteromonas sp. a30 TaxID=2730917 RepID=UPI00227E9934|nr:amino acid adenylation domain-containing protein [Alteromonas sp. a30]MCY7295213.1 amino acid adenylation domain-containing protein [Alteromonas sp. a30]
MTVSQNLANELSKENIENIFGLAPMQRGMLVQYAKDPETTAYIEQFDFQLSGPVDHKRLEQALNLVVQKYAVLRTIFSFRKTDEPRQIILKQRTVTLNQQDFSSADEQGIETWKTQERAKGFDLSQDLLMRTALLKHGDNQHRLVVTFHHIILDGWCIGLVFGDLFSFYEMLAEKPVEALANDPSVPLQEPHQYASFIQWLGQQNNEAGNTYWKEVLADYEAEVGIPWYDCAVTDSPEDSITQTHLFELDDKLTAQIDAIAKQHQITFNSVFQAAWGVLLQKYNNTQDAVFGAVVSGRPAALAGVADMVGLFINTQPLRVKAESTDSFITVAKAVHQQLINSSQYEFMALHDVQKQSPLGNDLLNHVVAFENYPIADRMKEVASSDDPNLLSVNDVVVYEQTNYDFNLIVNPGIRTKINFTYNAARFSENQMLQLQRGLETLIQAIANQPESAISALSICSENERDTVLNRFNDTKVDYPSDLTVPELFEQTVAEFGDRIALTGDKQKYTYNELRQHVINMASRLVAQGVQPGDTVAVLLPRCPDVIMTILAVQYAGAAWLPLDIKAPAERLAFILENAESKLVISHGDYVSALPASVSRILVESLSDSENASDAGFPKALTPESPAYIMYTSGSTGQPKGCTVIQKNIVRLVKNTNFATFDEKQVILSTGAPVFDATTFEYWGALLNGGKLCMYDDSVILDASRLKMLFAMEQVTTIWLTAALFNQLVDTDITLFSNIKQLLVGGDVVSLVHTRKVLEANPNIHIVNGYGPTENTTFSATYHIAEPSEFRFPIGKPINNSTCYIVDEQLNLLPPGAYGELCVGGDGVAQGYIKRPELNEQMFVDNPFEPGERLYRTGDIVRWLPDGNIDLQGRKDFQHKIRGFRIELGEIEWAINRVEGVTESIVMVKEDENAGKQLHAWFVSESPTIDEKKVRQKLLQQLPGYMVPGHMMRLDKFPLNTNGKVDRNQLREMQAVKLSNDNAVAPRNDIERSIADICQQVLGLDQISVFDNFFDVGADSLNLITINNRLKKALEKDIPVTAMFEHTSVARLADYLNPNEEAQKQQQAEEAEGLNNARKNLMKSRKLQRAMED